MNDREHALMITSYTRGIEQYAGRLPDHEYALIQAFCETIRFRCSEIIKNNDRRQAAPTSPSGQLAPDAPSRNPAR